LIGLAWFFMAVSIHFVNTHLVVLLVGIGHPALLSSSVLASVGVFSVINRAVSGGISDRLGRVRIFVAGVVSACLGLLTLLSLLTGEGARAVGWFYAFAVLFGLGTGAQTTQVTALASDLYRGRFFGSIIGFLTIGFGLGGAVGPWLGGLLFEWTGNYRVMIGYVLAAQAAAALFLIAAGRLGRSLREPPPADAGAR
jgi:MFS family permease